MTDDKDQISEIASALGMSQAEEDEMRLALMERHEKATELIKAVEALGQKFSVKDDDNVYVNVAWLGTMMLMEADQTMRGHGGCADHLRLVDLVQTTILAAVTNVEE